MTVNFTKDEMGAVIRALREKNKTDLLYCLLIPDAKEQMLSSSNALTKCETAYIEATGDSYGKYCRNY